MDPQYLKLLHRLQRIEEQLPNIPVRQAATAAGGGGYIPAKIVSKVSNRTYLCDLYANGIWITDGSAATRTTANVTVIFQQINSGQTIPAGTVVQVVSIGGHYEGFIPIWL